MSAEADLVALLRASAAVAAIVGTRIWPVRMPDNATLPGVVYQRVSTVESPDLGARSLRESRFQLDCWADRFGDTVTTAAAVIAALDYKSAASIDRILIDSARDLYDDAAMLYRRSVDVLIYEVP